MSFITVNLDDMQEAKPVPNGKYNLQITQCKVAKTGPNSKRPGSPQFAVTIGFVDEPAAPNISHYISLPHEEDEASAFQYKALLLKRFLVQFGIPYDSKGIDVDGLAMAMIGATANAEVSQTSPDESQNGDVYNRLITPKIRGEAESGGGRGAPPKRKG